MPQLFKKFLPILLTAAILASSACAKEAEPAVTTVPETTSVTSETTASATSETTTEASESTAATTVSETTSATTETTVPTASETTTETSDSTAATVSETTSTTSETTVPTASETTTTTSESTAVTTVSETTATTTKTTVPTASETTSTTSKTTEATSIDAVSSPAPKKETRKLSNPNASEQAQKLYDYICDTYGNAILSGQQESTWMGSEQYEFDYIFDKTGKYPAIRGLDYMNDDFSGVNRRAKEWHERGGIVTICWHCGCDFSGSWSECMNTEISDWNAALTEGTPEYDKLVTGMDKAAKALAELRDQGISVLWRPFHELDGGWFWWSKGGAENFKKLWTLMYDRYTNHWKLNNLIWVFGLSHEARHGGDWYPGEAYVDVAGADSYTDGANASLYRIVKRFVGEEMPVCFHECGRIPTVEQLRKENTNWVWFMTWHTEYITDHNDVGDLKKIYNDEYVITLDELPSL